MYLFLSTLLSILYLIRTSIYNPYAREKGINFISTVLILAFLG